MASFKDLQSALDALTATEAGLVGSDDAIIAALAAAKAGTATQAQLDLLSSFNDQLGAEKAKIDAALNPVANPALKKK